MTDRQAWTDHLLEQNPQLRVDQMEHQHNARKKLGQLIEQQGLPGVKAPKESEHDIQARLLARILNAGLLAFSIPNGANLFSGEVVLKDETDAADSTGAYIIDPSKSRLYVDKKTNKPYSLKRVLTQMHNRMNNQRHGQLKKLKAEGLTPGVPDLLVAEPALVMQDGAIAGWPRSNTPLGVRDDALFFIPGLFLETKVSGRPLSEDQKTMMQKLRERGYRCEKYDSVEAGWEIVCQTYGIEK